MKNGLLTIPEDGTIAAMWGRAIRERAVLHEWPLSRVERISFDDGRTAILKTQLREASAERAIYRAVRDPSILEPLADGEEDGCDWMLLPDLGEAHEDWGGLTDEAIRDRVRALSRIICRIDGDGIPVFFDFSSPELLARACVSILPTLEEAGMTAEELARLLDWAERDAPLLWDAPVVLLHGDLKGENVIPRENGPILIDWQRPMRGPAPLDEALALLLAGRVSRDRYAPLAAFVMGFWYAWAYKTCLPYPFVLGMGKKHMKAAIEGEEFRIQN